MRAIIRHSPLGFDPIILGLTPERTTPVRPVGDQRRTHERRTSGGDTRIDGRPPTNDRTGAHNVKCGCDDCGRMMDAYEATPDDVMDGLRYQRAQLLRMARFCAPSAVSDWYNVCRAGHTFYTRAQELDLRPVVSLQCAFLAETYETASMVLMARMMRAARERCQG